MTNSTVSGNANCAIRLQERFAGFGEYSNATLELIASTVSGDIRALFRRTTAERRHDRQQPG